ncbi:phosphoribosylaminoimidazolesuccinocarboxamide synthase [Alicyclobacillus mengziensis]|uniref:Phosphoribosylaminoimidazole-succinocarboxamide synthase n=1 Tax=Alicyclobacillus mengziensis TaxID=2931921 RepID=A0A9X7VXQ7_9BACL|nr:phosphoribosylaminoimidazolesuccinocarboxamide synthase [Alicyclobacillus mengziensis]QSO46963.1 phosphoribosylaminoimidazolesuccinocarboxamide synthase [Alicyclobacillus mengziensis]
MEQESAKLTAQDGPMYEGKAKRVYKTDDDGIYMVSYKDDATAFNGQKRGTISGKGIVNNQMSNLFFQLLEQNGVPTHFVKELNERETLVRALTMLPVEVVIRNLAAGSMAARLGLEEGMPLSRPIVEYYYKRDDLGDPLVTVDHIEVLGMATPEDLAQVQRLALRVNEVLSETLRKVDVILVDFKLEFGKTKDGRIVLADEISPDTCRYWDANTKEKLDKDRFRRDLGGVEDAYAEMMRRVKEVTRL